MPKPHEYPIEENNFFPWPAGGVFAVIIWLNLQLCLCHCTGTLLAQLDWPSRAHHSCSSSPAPAAVSCYSSTDARLCIYLYWQMPCSILFQEWEENTYQKPWWRSEVIRSVISLGKAIKVWIQNMNTHFCPIPEKALGFFDLEDAKHLNSIQALFQQVSLDTTNTSNAAVWHSLQVILSAKEFSTRGAWGCHSYILCSIQAGWFIRSRRPLMVLVGVGIFQ